jgi:hypothetical protein
MVVRIPSQTVVRESDGRTLLLVEGYCGDRDRPLVTQVVERPDDDKFRP